MDMVELLVLKGQLVSQAMAYQSGEEQIRYEGGKGEAYMFE